MTQPLVIAAHGSRDPRSAAAMRALAAAVGRFWNAPVTVGFLDFNGPTVTDAVRAAGPGAIVIPALLTHAYHGRIDIPAAVADAGVPATVTPVLGGVEPEPLLLNALAARARAIRPTPRAIAVLAAGTRDKSGRRAVSAVARDLGALLGCPATVGYASSDAPTAADAIAAVGIRPRDVLTVTYFLAPGRLADAAHHFARTVGVTDFTQPLCAPVAPDLVHLVWRRATAASRAPVAARPVSI